MNAAHGHQPLWPPDHHQYHGGAENRDSPLFKDDFTYGMGAALVIPLYQSKARAEP